MDKCKSFPLDKTLFLVDGQSKDVECYLYDQFLKDMSDLTPVNLVVDKDYLKAKVFNDKFDIEKYIEDKIKTEKCFIDFSSLRNQLTFKMPFSGRIIDELSLRYLVGTTVTNVFAYVKVVKHNLISSKSKPRDVWVLKPCDFQKYFNNGELSILNIPVSNVGKPTYTNDIQRNLFEAVKYNDINNVKIFISKGGLLNEELFGTCVLNNSADIMTLLYSFISNLNNSKEFLRFSTMLALDTYNEPFLLWLKDKVDINSQDFLQKSIDKNNSEVITYLINLGVKINNKHLMSSIINHNNELAKVLIDRLEILNKDDQLDTLNLCIDNNNIEMLEYLLETTGIDPNIKEPQKEKTKQEERKEKYKSLLKEEPKKSPSFKRNNFRVSSPKNKLKLLVRSPQKSQNPIDIKAAVIRKQLREIENKKYNEEVVRKNKHRFNKEAFLISPRDLTERERNDREDRLREKI